LIDMKVLVRPSYGSTAPGQSVDVSSAVENAMTGYVDSDRGALERLRDEMENHKRFVGELVEKLCERGTLDAETLQHLLGSDFRVSP